jgi:integrase/recombinase XerD
MKPTIELQPGDHKAQEVVFLRFGKDQELIQAVKSLGCVRWSATKSCWYIVKDEFKLGSVFESLKNHAFLDYSALKQENRPPVVQTKTKPVTLKKELGAESLRLVEDFRLWMQHKRYSASTIKTYCEAISIFLAFIGSKNIREINNDDMVDFVNQYIIPQGYSFSYQNQVIGATKLFFREIVKSRIEIESLSGPGVSTNCPMC